VVVEPDLQHRRGAAGAEALDLGERELPVFGRLARLDAQASRAVLGDFVRAEELARERLANLYVILPDRLDVNHRVEGRDLPDVRDAHAQAVRQIRDAGRVEVAALALHDEHQRQYGRALQRILREVAANLRLDLRRELRYAVGDVHLLRQRVVRRELLAHKFPTRASSRRPEVLLKTFQASGTVVTAPTRKSVQPTARRCCGPSLSARS